MRIPKIEEAFRECQTHFSGKTDTKVEVQNLLTQALLVLICARFERKIIDIAQDKCASTLDKSKASFLSERIPKVLRSPSIGNVTRLLKIFGKIHKKTFQCLLDQKQREMYSSLIYNRNLVAHGEGSYATFDEIKEYYEHAHHILDYFHDALFRPSND